MMSTSYVALCGAVAANRSVISLDLSSSKLGPGGAEALKLMLIRNKGLQELVLAYSGESGGPCEDEPPSHPPAPRQG